MNKLLSYFNGLDKPSRAAFLKQTKLTEGYLRKACSVGQTLNPIYCKRIEEASGGKVTRKQLRPHDWKEIWG